MGKIRSNHVHLDHSRSTSFMNGEGVHEKSDKRQRVWRECSQTLMLLSPIFLFSNFLSTEFLILPISSGSDNVKENSIKTHPRGFPYVCYSYITRSKAKFCQHGLLVHMYLCVKVNTKIAENSCF